MSTHNLLKYSMECPRCKKIGLMEIELYFGFANLIEYKIGDEIKWIPNKSLKNGGRPKNGYLNGEGYSECSVCGKDFFVKVEIRLDKLTNVVVDNLKAPYRK